MSRRALPALLALLVLLGAAAAQPALVVNGVAVPGNTTDLVQGTSYAPAAALANALGAEAFPDAQRTVYTLKLGGHVLQAAIAGDAAAAAQGGLVLDGRTVDGPGALQSGPEVFLPVKPVAEALGGRVAYLAERQTVVVVQPRARLSAILRQRSGSEERLVLRLSAPVRTSSFLNEPVNTLELHLERTDLSAAVSAVEGDDFVRAAASASAGAVDVRVTLQDGVRASSYALPDGRGFELVITFARGPADAGAGAGGTIVLDPGHGGQDPGLRFPGYGSEASLTLAFAQRLRGALQARGFQVRLTRDSDTDVPADRRSADGIGADLFLSIHGAALPPGQYHAYYLADADGIDSLQMAIRANAQDAAQRQTTDSLRRRILLDLVPDLDVGRRFVDGLGAQLFQAAGFRSSDTAGVPLYVLGGAAGRGVLMEFSPEDLDSTTLPDTVAAALDAVFRAGGGSP